MACINLGAIDKSLYFILAGCIFCFLNRLLSKIEMGKILFESPILTNICISLSRFLTIIPYIILIIRTKNQTKSFDIEKKNTLTSFVYNDRVKEVKKGKWKYILLSAFIYLINSFFFAQSFTIKTNAWIWYILIAALFYYWIFKIQLHKHHYLSIVLIILLGLVIDLITKNLQEEIVSEPLKLVMKFLKEIFFSLYNVIGKYVMEKKHVSVYEFSFYIGLFNLLVLLIFSIFDYYFIKWTPFEIYFDNFNYKQLLIALGVIFTQLGINITTLFTTKYNSPCHVFIIFVFGQIAYYINFSGIFPLVIVLLIIILFLSLIFNEIIEINLFGLSYNTKRNIMIRAMNESEAKKEIDNQSECESNNQNESKNSSKNGSFAEINGIGEIGEIIEDQSNLEKSLNNEFIINENNYIKI